MNSRLYVGHVAHARTRPAKNAFRYPVYYFGLDLDELDQVDASLRWFSHNAGNVVSFWDRDHGPRDGTPLKPWIEALCARAGVDIAGGRVMLLTFPRVFSARFYPVSFWYCYSADGVPRAVLAEVHNTFGDRHNYLLHAGGEPYRWDSRPTKVKAFYVSPFIQRENVIYEFDVTDPAQGPYVSVRDIVEGEPMLTSTITLTAQDLTDAALLGTVMRHGPISIVALIRIHWQALKLAFKRVPFFPHSPAPPEENSL